MSEKQYKRIYSTSEFEYIPIIPEYEDRALDILAYSFTHFDSTSKFLRIPLEINKEFARNVLDSYRARELSLVCIHKPTLEVCGAALVHEIHPDYPIQYSDAVNHYQNPIFLMLKQLEENISIDWINACYYDLIAVDFKWKGKNIAFKLSMALEEHVKNKKFSLIKVEAMNPITQNFLYNHLGFTELSSIKYNEFMINGEKIFPGLEGHCSLGFKMLRD